MPTIQQEVERLRSLVTQLINRLQNAISVNNSPTSLKFATLNSNALASSFMK